MSDLQQLEKQLKEFSFLRDRRQAALRLSENLDFKKIILEDFMVKECATYAQLSADPARTLEERADCLNIAQAAGHLKRYLSVIIQMGFHAENEHANLQEAIELARAEEDAD